MNRRDFIRIGLLAGSALALRNTGPTIATPGTPTLALREGQIVDAAGTPQVTFGPDLIVTDLHIQDGIWFARLMNEPQALTFWLKSYNGQVWGSLDWEPSPNSPARKSNGS